jgi:hypothetical protein
VFVVDGSLWMERSRLEETEEEKFIKRLIVRE